MTSCTTNPKPLSHKLSIEYLPPEALALDPKNARLHSPAQIKQIAASIKAFEFNAPILIDREGKIIAGHGRYLACRELGRKEIPVIRLEHLTPDQARAFAIADNRLAENAKWDQVMLAEHFLALDAVDLDFSLDVTGFNVAEIDLMIAGDDGGEDDPADEPAPVGPPIAAPGDVWMLGRHVVLCGDALDEASYAALLGSDRAAMVFTDPPYNVRIDGNVSNLMGGKAARKHREFAAASGEMTEAEFVDFLTKACTLMAKASCGGAVH